MKLRILAAFLAVFCGVIFGVSRSEKLKKRMLVCTEADKVFRLFETMIRSSGADIYSVLSMLQREHFCALGFVKKLPAEYTAEYDFHSLWRELLIGEQDIPQEEKGILLDFGELLGTSDIDGQLRGIAAAKALMQKCFERRCEEYHCKAKLYRSVGVLAGVMAGIMVI